MTRFHLIDWRRSHCVAVGSARAATGVVSPSQNFRAVEPAIVFVIWKDKPLCARLPKRHEETTMDLPRDVQEAADVSAVSQLVLRERVSRDLGLWEQMRDCFHDDSVVRISWFSGSGPEFVRRSIEMA